MTKIIMKKELMKIEKKINKNMLRIKDQTVKE